MNHLPLMNRKFTRFFAILLTLTGACSTNPRIPTQAQGNWSSETLSSPTQVLPNRIPILTKGVVTRSIPNLQPTTPFVRIFQTPLPMPEITPIPAEYFTTIIKPSRSEEAGRSVVTAYWSNHDEIIYGMDTSTYEPLPKEPLWFSIDLQNLQESSLTKPPKITYPPILYPEVVYPQYTGFVSPTGKYSLEIVGSPSEFVIETPDPVMTGLWLVNRSGGGSKTKLISRSDLVYHHAYWFSDESKVIFGIGPGFGTVLYLLDVDAMMLTPVSELTDFEDVGLLEWSPSPDGKRIAMVDGIGNLHILSLDSEPAIVLPGFHQNVRWTWDSQAVFYYHGPEWIELETLDKYDLRTKTSEYLINLSNLEKKGVYGSFDVSPTGDRLVFWESNEIRLVFLSGNYVNK